MFKQIDPVVKKETVFIAGVVLVGSVLMQAVFLLLSRWDYTVLLGNVLGAALAIGNFLLMGITVQKALGRSSEDAKKLMKASQQLRLLMLVVGCVLGGAIPCFNLVAVVVPLLIPRVGVTIRGLTNKE